MKQHLGDIAREYRDNAEFFRNQAVLIATFCDDPEQVRDYQLVADRCDKLADQCRSAFEQGRSFDHQTILNSSLRPE
jgi:hypothetical protein